MKTAVLTINDILPRLEKCKPTGPSKWQACCPAHEDTNPSLSISEGEDGKPLLYCHAGCSYEEIMGALNGGVAIPQDTAVHTNGYGSQIKPNRRIVATYDYCDENGRLLYQKLRYEPKDFRIRRPNGAGGWIWKMGNIEPILYHLPDVEKVQLFSVVYIVEGEKDADKLASLGLPATCNYDGASKANQRPKWRPDLYNHYLDGRVVYILPDNDEPGRAHAEYIASTLHGIAQCVKVVDLPGLGKSQDVSDWLDMGHTKEELERVCLLTPKWQQVGETAVPVSVNGDRAETAVSANADSLMPTLPETAVIDPVLGKEACPWLDAYVDFSRRMSPRGYDDFHEAIGLWLLSTVAARRLVLKMGTKAFSPNLYLSLCSHTTLYAKTTTARVAQDVLQAAGLSYFLLPNDMTPQAFINELVPRLRSDYGELSLKQQEWERRRLMFPAQRGWFYDEFGTKIQAMMRDSGFMAEFRGLLRIFDDNQPRYEYKTMTRRDTVERPYLALLASMTPADLRPFAKPGAALWQDGFWARWAFVTPPLNHPPKYGRFADKAEDIPTELSEPIRQWHQVLGIPQVTIEEVINDKGDPTGLYRVDRDEVAPKTCTVGNGVMDAYYTYHDGLTNLAAKQEGQGNTDLIGNYGRFAEKGMRVAMLLASVSNQNRIELSHWARAQAITERWRANLHHLFEQVQTSAPSQERQFQDKVVEILKRHGPGTAADIGRYIRNMGSSEVDEISKRLVKSGVLIVAEVTQRKTSRYAIAEL